jgi:uncharacterized protein DUF3606
MARIGTTRMMALANVLETPTMPDNPRIRDKRDRGKVSRQEHELDYLKEKFDISGQAAAAAQRVAGPNRAKVEAYIKEKKKAGDY